jgi:RNA polymerase sigma factor (TIGR02999 family)
MEQEREKTARRARPADRAAADALLPLVYDQLRALAAKELRAEKPGHTLQPTALVHEAYMRLAEQTRAKWNDRTHFLAVAAVAIRRILVNHAKARGRTKRGGSWVRVPLDDALDSVQERAVDVDALDAALKRLAAIDPLQERIVELRFFGGLTAEQTARALEVPLRTVEREWAVARAWLRAEVAGASGGEA